MPFKYTFCDRRTHLLVESSGSPSDAAEMSQYIDSLFYEAKKRGHVSVLVDETAVNLRFDILDGVFKDKLPNMRIRPSAGVAVALVSAPYNLELYKFFEGMLRGHDFTFKCFGDKDLAEQWLIDTCRLKKPCDRPFSYVAHYEKDYVRINISGVIDTVNDILIISGDMIREAIAHKTTCILSDSRELILDLDVSQAFAVAQTLGDYIPLLGMRVATLPHPKAMELNSFFETAFQNRSINFRVFETEEAAESWILERNCRAHRKI